jgi:predicted permease
LVSPLRQALHPTHPLWDIPAIAKYLVGPVGMILLGCLMAQVPPKIAGHRLDITCACVLRGLVVPAVTLMVLLWIRPDPVMALVVMIQASTPPATNLSVIAAYYKGPVGRITSTFMPSYLMSCLTLPLWVGAALHLFGPF